MTTIGVSGVGSIGTRHVRVLSGFDEVEIVVHDPVSDADDLTRRLGPGVRVAPSFEALLDGGRDGLDGLVIAAPDPHHGDQSVAAAERGIAVLLEKPLAGTVEDGHRIVDAVARTGTPVLVGYVLRHVGCMRRAHQLLLDGAIGQPVSFQLMLGSYQTLRVARNRFSGHAYGSLFVDYSHEWDYLRWLVGPVAGGFASARTAGDLPLSQDPNVVDAVLRLRDGTTGTAHLDYVQDPGTRSFTIIGDRGTLRVDVPTGEIQLHRPGAVAGEQEVTRELVPESVDHSFHAQAAHFLDVARRDAAPVVTATDGMAALAVADLLRRSALDGRWRDVVEQT